MEGHEFLLEQLLDRSTRSNPGMTASDQDCDMVIEKLSVHEWIKHHRQPVNSDIYDAVAYALLEIGRPGNRVEAERNTRSRLRCSRSKGERVERSHWMRNA